MRSKLSFGRLPGPRRWLPYLVLIAALVLTGVIIYFVERSSEADSRQEFEVASEETKLNIQTHIESYRALLRGGSGLFSALETVTRSQFQAYVARLKFPVYYPGVRGIGYSVRLMPQERERVIASLRRQGISNFRIWPAQERAEYHAVIYLEPADQRNQLAFGYDMFTDPTRREAMERARDQGIDAASGKVKLIQQTEEPGQASFIIYVPVYRGGIPQEVVDRRAALQGFVYGLFRVGDLLAGILDTHHPLPLGLEVYDGSELKPENLLHRSSWLQPGDASRAQFQKRSTIHVAGRPWTLAFYSAAKASSAATKMLVSVIAVGGVLLSLVLFYFTHAEARARTEAERTSAELQQSESALRESEQQLSAIFNQATAGIAQTDMTGRFVLVNKTYCDIVGRSMEELLCLRMQDLTHPDDLPLNLELIDRMVAGGPGFTIEKRYVRKDGSCVWVKNSVSALIDSSGKPQYVVAISQDISDRKQAEEALEEESRTLEVINQIGTALAAELNLERLVQAVTDAGTEVTGAQFGALFYNAVNKEGEADTLFALSGAPRKVCEQLPPPRTMSIFGPTFRSDGIVRIADVLEDPHYRRNPPLAGLLKRFFTVRSYLATPVISRSGEVLGGLFFGHPEPGVFTERAERIITGIAAQAAIAIDNARLYQATQIELAERKRAEEALRQSEERFRQLADAMPQIVWTADPDGAVDYYNKRWYEFTGFSDEKGKNKGWAAILHPDDAQAFQDSWRAAFSTGQLFQLQYRLQEYQTAEYRWHLGRALPIRDSNGKIARWFGSSTDIDDTKRAEEEVHRLVADLERRVSDRTAQLEASNKELEAFSYSVSHDLRAPLRSINGFNQALLEEYQDELDARGKEYLERAQAASRRMGRLIDDMLHLFRLSRSELIRREVDLSELAKSVATEQQKADPARLVKFDFSPGLIVSGDERLLRIALENLLGNAWKFTSKRAQGLIEFGAESQGGKLAYFVRDNGAGFNMAYADKLFGVFQRLHSTAEFPGTGIGLATVQRIIHRHGGQIWAAGEPEKGATFYFSLPG